MHNLLTLTDSYKVTHWKQYPEDARTIHSYLECRNHETYGSSVFFGLQYLLRRYLAGRVVTPDLMERARKRFLQHFGSSECFNYEGWNHVAREHGGRLPLSIQAVPEGTEVPVGNVLMTIENTCPECRWVTNYVETLLVQLWYPMVVATNSWHLRRQLERHIERSGSGPVEHMLHDFGCRGSTSMESAALGGAAHLVSFTGTDTLPALDLIDTYYALDCAGFSVPAAEHSTITAWGEDREEDAYRNMLEQFPTGPVSVVSDSYSLTGALEMWAGPLRDKVLERDGPLVVRPDSGDPLVQLPEVLRRLERGFGATVNPKGYRVLDPHVRVIQGDGVGRDSLGLMCHAVQEAGYSIDNLVFGSGGGLLQKFNRDTLGVALKCCAVTTGSGTRDCYKTAPGKQSKRGRLKLVRVGRGFETVPASDPRDNVLTPVFLNGVVTRHQNFDNIRKRLHDG